VRTLLCLIVVVASTLVVGGCDPDAYPAAVPMASLVVARVLDGRGCHLPVLLTMTCEVSPPRPASVHAAALAYRYWAARMLQLQRIARNRRVLSLQQREPNQRVGRANLAK
jgi:hypothetical protein